LPSLIARPLRETGTLENTYVIFTADNGHFLGEHRLPEGKGTPYEEAIRVPFVVRGPGVAAGEVRLTPCLKRALELSATEARNLDHHYIGTEHLLLGLLREREGVGAEVLRDLGVGIAEVRARVVTMVGRGPKT